MASKYAASGSTTGDLTYEFDTVEGGEVISTQYIVRGVQRSSLELSPACVSPQFAAKDREQLITTRLHHNYHSFLSRYQPILNAARTRKIPTDFEGRRLFVVGGHANFYHFITNYVARCFYYLTRPDARGDDLFLVFDGMPQHYWTYLDLIGVRADRRIAVSNQIYVRCPQAIWSNLPHYFDYGLHGDKVAFDWLRSRICRIATGPRRRRLILSRGKAAHRRLLNEPQLLAIAKRYGFEVVFPEEHSVTDVLTLFGSAQALVSTYGGSMTNSLFCAQDCKIVELAGEGARNKHNTHALTALAQQRCTRVIAREVESEKIWAYRDLVVDAHDFELALQRAVE